MPNWCHNRLTITGPNVRIAAFKLEAVGHSPWFKPEELVGERPNPLNFHSLVPIPDHVLAADYHTAGYDWEHSNWGCKWGAANPILRDEVGQIQYEFDTAWSPPVKLLLKVAQKWSDLVFVLEYEEPAMAFKGMAKFWDRVCEDHCLSVSL